MWCLGFFVHRICGKYKYFFVIFAAFPNKICTFVTRNTLNPCQNRNHARNPTKPQEYAHRKRICGNGFRISGRLQ